MKKHDKISATYFKDMNWEEMVSTLDSLPAGSEITDLVTFHGDEQEKEKPITVIKTSEPVSTKFEGNWWKINNSRKFIYDVVKLISNQDNWGCIKGFEDDWIMKHKKGI